jgi:hypothetical protein
MIKLKSILFERDENDTNNTGGVLYCYGDNKFLLCLGSRSGKYQFKPQYGSGGFMSVAHTRADGVDNWGKNKKIKVTSQMKKQMIKTLQDAIKSKYKGSQETEILLRNNERLHSVLSWVKKLK